MEAPRGLCPPLSWHSRCCWDGAWGSWRVPRVYIHLCPGITNDTGMGVILFAFSILGFVVGHAGLIQAMAMLLVAYFILALTVLSVCAIATNGAVRGGGAYCILFLLLGCWGPRGLPCGHSSAGPLMLILVPQLPGATQEMAQKQLSEGLHSHMGVVPCPQNHRGAALLGRVWACAGRWAWEGPWGTASSSSSGFFP